MALRCGRARGQECRHDAAGAPQRDAECWLARLIGERLSESELVTAMMAAAAASGLEVA